MLNEIDKHDLAVFAAKTWAKANAGQYDLRPDLFVNAFEGVYRSAMSLFSSRQKAEPEVAKERVLLTAGEIESLTALVASVAWREFAPESAAALRLLVQIARQDP